MVELGDLCRKLAEEYRENMGETREILNLVNDVWNGTELGEYIQQLQSSISETEKTMQTLIALSKLLLQTGESMRNAEQMAASQIRDSTNCWLRKFIEIDI